MKKNRISIRNAISLLTLVIGAIILILAIVYSSISALMTSILILWSGILICIPSVFVYIVKGGRQALKKRINIWNSLGLTILVIGLIFVVLSIVYSSSPSAFAGLGLTFWGLILLYIRCEEYVKQDVMRATVTGILKSMNDMMSFFKGRAVYLPPKYLKNPQGSKVLLLKPSEKVPIPEQMFSLNPQMLITPLGGDLAKLIEEKMGKGGVIDIEMVKEKLPTVIVEELEFAREVGIDVVDECVLVNIQYPFYVRMLKDIKSLPNVFNALDCPLSSAIACILAKTTGKPIVIRQISNEGENIKIEYNLIEDNKTG